MTPFGIAYRYLRIRPWVTLLTVLSLSLGTALPCVILILRHQVEHALLREGKSVDLVVGAKGSPLQLVLSSIHHLDLPTGNIPWSQVEALRADSRVVRALPIGLGDNFRGYRIVGTDAGFRDWRDASGGTPHRLAAGEWFSRPFEVVAGADVAERLGLRPGDTFVGAHGLVAAPGTDHDEFPYTVTGILEATGWSVDRLILTPIESVWEVHAEEQNRHNRMFASGTAAANVEPEITSVLLRLRSPGLRMWMREEINDQTNAMAAAPVDELLRLYRGVLRPVQSGLFWMAAAVVAVSGCAILSTLLQAAERRKRDWATLRMVGAHPGELGLLIQLEAVWIALFSVAAGVLMARGGLAMAGHLSSEPLLASMSLWRAAPGEGAVWLTVFVFGSCIGFVPALLMYRRSPLEDLQ